MVVGPTFRFAVSRIHSILWISILVGRLGDRASVCVLLIIPGVIVFVRFVFGSTVLVVEGRKGSKALGRSWRLAKGSFWKIARDHASGVAPRERRRGDPAVPGAVAFAAIGPAGWPFYAIGLSLAAIITTPFTTLITVLLYFDLRIRKEAFDLEVMAQEMSSQR